MKQESKRSILAVVLTALTVFATYPSSAFAEEIHEPSVSSAKADEIEIPYDAEALTNTADSMSQTVIDDQSEQADAGDGSIASDTDVSLAASRNATPSLSSRIGVLSDDTVNLSSGLYFVRSNLVGTSSLDVSGASSAAGANVQIWSGNDTPAQRFHFQVQNDGYYMISNLSSGKVLDVTNASNQSGTNVQQWDPNESDAQKWKIVDNGNGYTIVSKLTSADGMPLVLDVSGANISDGTNVQVYESNSTVAQSWSLIEVQAAIPDGTYRFVSGLSSERALDISGASFQSGGNAQLWESNGTSAQRFQISYDSSNGYYTIRSANSGLVLDVENGSSIHGANVQQWTSNGTLAQKWSISSVSDGVYTLRSAVSGLALDVSNGSSKSGANVQIWETNGTVAQQWELVSTPLISDGLYTISCNANHNIVLDVSDASLSEGGNVQVWADNDSWAQKFAINEYEDSPYYTIRNLNSGLLLGIASGSAFAGANFDQGHDAGPSETQLWKPVITEGGMTWVSKTGFVLDVANGIIESGTNVQVWNANDTSAQKFSLKPTTAVLSDGVYELESSLQPGMVVDIPSASTDNGEKAQIWTSNNTAAQRFYVSSFGDGFYRLTSLCSNKSLDVKDYEINPADGSGVVQQWTNSDNDAQRWRIEITKDGFLSVYSKCGNGGSCLTVSNGIATNGAQIGVFVASGTPSQKFSFKPAQSSVTRLSMNMTLAQQTGYQMITDEYNNYYHTYDEYYTALDPDRVSSMTQFADLRGYSGLTADQLNGFIASTGNGRSGTLNGRGQAFVDAAKSYGLNEVYVLSHAILESGWGMSDLAGGYDYSGGWLDGEYYGAGTYYNYFGIGAYDSSPLSGGRKMAIINGWDSPEKAIIGGARWISENYTYSSAYPQYTLYNMRFDILRSNATLARGWHQYATSLTWTGSIARLIDACYSYEGVPTSFSYVMPSYR